MPDIGIQPMVEEYLSADVQPKSNILHDLVLGEHQLPNGLPLKELVPRILVYQKLILAYGYHVSISCRPTEVQHLTRFWLW